MRVPPSHRSAAAYLAVLITFGGAAVASHAASAAPKPGVVLRFAASPSSPQSCARVSWVFRVSNVGRAVSRLSFRDGQRGEVVLSRAGRVVYRWSARRGFTQALWSRSIARGRTWRFALADVLRVPAGRYSLVARLTGTTTAPARLVVRRTMEVRGPARTCGSSDASPQPPPAPPAAPPPAAPPPPAASPPPSAPGGAPARPPGASLTTARGSIRLAYGSYCWMLGMPADGTAAPCTDLIPSDDPGIPRLSVAAGDVLTLRLAIEPTSLAILLGSPGVTARIDSEPQREVSFRVPASFRPPNAGLLVVVADGSAGELGSGQVSYLVWLTAATE